MKARRAKAPLDTQWPLFSLQGYLPGLWCRLLCLSHQHEGQDPADSTILVADECRQPRLYLKGGPGLEQRERGWIGTGTTNYVVIEGQRAQPLNLEC